MKDISSLYEAAKIYFQSRGIAWFNLKAIDRVVRFLAQNPNFIDSTTVNNAEILTGLKLARKGREAGYILKFLWYIGFLNCKYLKGKFYYKLNTTGWKYYKLRYQQDPRTAFTYLYHIVTTGWEPLLKTLEYIESKKRTSAEDIENDLGGEMKYWTGIMANFGFKVKPVKKPYNNFVIKTTLIPLMRELGLIEEENRKYSVTEQGKHVLERARREYDVIRTRPREPLIYAAICNVLLAKESTIISPWIDQETAQNIVNGILQGTNKYTKITTLRIITKRPDQKTKSALKTLAKLKNHIEVEAGYITGQQVSLHAKTYHSEKTAIITSANLLRQSLWKNFELGIHLYQTPPTLQQTTEEIWQHTQPYNL